MTIEIVLSILDSCFKELSNVESISKIKTQSGYIESWKIETEIPYYTFQKEADLIISFPSTFPVTLPRIFLEEYFYNETKYLPHINEDKSVCLFDESFTFIDADRPFDIIKACIKNAKQILQQGFEKTNINEFSKEIWAYWAHNYHDKDKISRRYLSLLNTNIETSKIVKLLEIVPSHNRVTRYFISDSSDCEFLLHLKEKGYKFNEFDALYLDKFDLKNTPPYDHTNISFLDSLSPLNREIFRKYINKSTLPHVFFTMGDKMLGFKVNPLETNRDGFRKGVLTPSKVIETFQKNDYLTRIIIDKYDSNRIERRTSGLQNEKFRFLVVGLGSIGSNLAYFLNAMNYPSFTFVDNETLSIDNIGRHFLGFEAVQCNKAEALKHYFKDIRPDQKIITKSDSIQDILFKDVTIFNENDFAFLCIGNQNIERYVIDLIDSNRITTPTFIIWVEPFLIGGHCIFIHPNKPISKEELFNKQSYKYHVISDQSYEDKIDVLLMREAGCQTTYVPYSANHITLFLSQIYYYIDDQIKNRIEESYAIRWTGDLDLASNLGITMSSGVIRKYNVEKNAL